MRKLWHNTGGDSPTSSVASIAWIGVVVRASDRASRPHAVEQAASSVRLINEYANSPGVMRKRLSIDSDISPAIGSATAYTGTSAIETPRSWTGDSRCRRSSRAWAPASS
jgi:hypothetical protein